MTLLLPHLIKGTHGSEVATVYWVGGLLCVNVVLTGLLYIPDSVLVGTNQGYRSMMITTAVMVTSNVAMVAAAFASWGVGSLALIVLVANILNGGITWVAARRAVSWFGVRRHQRTEGTNLAKFSGWVLTWSLINKLLLASELILFSALVGAAAVSNYSFTSYVIVFALSIALMTTSALMPQLGAQIGPSSLERARSVVTDAKDVTLAVVMISGASVLLFNRAFVTLWVGSERYLGNTLNALIVAAFVQLAIIRNDAQIQDTGMNIRFKVLVGSASTILSIGLAVSMFEITHHITTIYLGLIIGRLPATLIFPGLVHQLVPGTRFGLRAHLVTGIVLVASYFVGLKLRLPNLFAFAGGTLVGVAVLGVIAYSFILSPQTRRKVLPESLRRFVPTGASGPAAPIPEPPAVPAAPTEDTVLAPAAAQADGTWPVAKFDDETKNEKSTTAASARHRAKTQAVTRIVSTGQVAVRTARSTQPRVQPRTKIRRTTQTPQGKSGRLAQVTLILALLVSYFVVPDGHSALLIWSMLLIFYSLLFSAIRRPVRV